MNLCTTALDGKLREIDPNSARAAASFLGERLPHVEEREQPGMLRAMRELEFAATPVAHLDMAFFTPKWYVPGWVADP